MLSAVPVLLVLFGSVGKILLSHDVVVGMAKAGISGDMVRPIGALELFCLVVYVVPRTALLGAILLTCLFGGAIITQLRVGDSAFIFPLALGLMTWGGLYLREERLRALVPLRR